MQYYLSQFAEHVYLNYKDSLSKICIVFPNRRAGLFFQQYLAEKIDNPIWSPQILTIKDFVFEYTSLSQGENLKLLYELYKVYLKIKKSDENFDDFLPWGEIILRDFDELDKYLVNADELFKNIYELKKIDQDYNYLTPEQISAISKFWKTFSNIKLSKNQNNFIYIWELLSKLYADYKESLFEKNIAYEGMIYRDVAEKIKSENLPVKFNFEKVLFVGFNAINNAEEAFFNYFKQKDIAEFYWDYDEYYLNPEHHEAGKFLRKNFNKFSKINININSKNFQSEKEIQIVSCPSDLMQANILSNLLSDILPNKSEQKIKFNETAVVLADENLLIPVLYSIPNNFNEVNVTMGYPLSNTPAYSFVEIIVELALNSMSKEGKIYFHHIDVENLLYHNYSKFFDSSVNQLVVKIKEKNLSYLSLDFLSELKIFDDVEKLSKGAFELLEFIQSKLSFVFQFLEKEESSIDKEFVFYTYNELKKFYDIILLENLNIKKETFIKLLRKIISLAKIPFAGEPLSGIQVLGILETRLLDFKNLIILSLNEGTFPPSSAANSFIPYNLRKGFGMPTIEYGDAMYSYYFYRLIQRAESVYLLYNTDKSFESAGEMSRFLYQLKYESGLNISIKDLNYNVEIQKPKEIRIKKADYKEKLSLYFNSNERKYFSPSSLNTYLDCSLKFYFQYILKISEPEEVTDEIGHDVFGNILHDILQNLYEKHEGQEITKEILNTWINNDFVINNEILKSYKMRYSNSDEKPTGQNIIVIETIKKYVKQVLNYDKSRLPFRLIATEEAFNIDYEFSVKGENQKVKIGGKIDRIDLKDNIVQLIDYKSGNVKLDVKNGIENLFSDERKNRNSAALQMLLYSYIYNKTNESTQTIAPSIYPVRELYNHDFNTFLKIDKQKVNNFSQYEQELEEQLNLLLSEIFDFDGEFCQTDDSKSCEYCAYNKICHKDSDA